jgi:two-component system KDP operon response regulator KdpE
MKTTILIIDDDRIFCEAVKDFLSDGEKEVSMAHSGKEGLSVYSARKVDIVLLDRKLPDGEEHKL